MELLFALRVIARNWLLPPSSLLLIALASVWLAGRRPLLGRLLAGLATGLLFLMSMPLVADRLTLAASSYPRVTPAQLARSQAIVVLAGGVRGSPLHGEGEPRPETLDRLAYGAELARATGLPLLLSGGVVIAGAPEALAMDGALRRAFGLHARWLETRSRDTAENARYSAAMLAAHGVRRAVLVTSAVHMRRSVRAFAGLGIEVVPAPVGAPMSGSMDLGDWLPKAGALERSCAAIYEIVGQLVARA